MINYKRALVTTKPDSYETAEVSRLMRLTGQHNKANYIKTNLPDLTTLDAIKQTEKDFEKLIEQKAQSERLNAVKQRERTTQLEQKRKLVGRLCLMNHQSNLRYLLPELYKHTSIYPAVALKDVKISDESKRLVAQQSGPNDFYSIEPLTTHTCTLLSEHEC
ncbi:hypothetical protein BCT19_01260 [Vibrio splendidus]|nr:hypothetical protein BCT19_01260 [Vibrio splendidus]